MQCSGFSGVTSHWDSKRLWFSFKTEVLLKAILIKQFPSPSTRWDHTSGYLRKLAIDVYSEWSVIAPITIELMMAESSSDGISECTQ